MPFIITLIIYLIQAAPAIIKLIMEIWKLINQQPSKEGRLEARNRLITILTKAKEARFVSSTQAAELEQLLADLKKA